MPAATWVGVGACAAALLVTVLVLALPARTRVPRSRLVATPQADGGALAGAADGTEELAERLLRRLGWLDRLGAALERAGMTVRPAEVAVVTAVATGVMGALGSLAGGVLLAVLLAGAAPVAVALVIGSRRSRRQAAFADQLDDTLQLMAGSLRAGHSVLRSIEAIARDAGSPTSDEFARVLNETRVGRDPEEALTEVAERTGSIDFDWVVQAVAIHREVGGNLADVLDRVGATIRERNALRRQAKALSAEGRLSGIVLMGMPFVVLAVMSAASPAYVARLTGTTTGWLLLALAAVLLVVGGLWLRVVIRVRY